MKDVSDDKNNQNREDKLSQAVKLLATVVSETNARHEKAGKKSNRVAKEIAIIDDSSNSELTFGPTFSTLLKSTSEFKLFDNEFLISGIRLLFVFFCSTFIK